MCDLTEKLSVMPDLYPPLFAPLWNDTSILRSFPLRMRWRWMDLQLQLAAKFYDIARQCALSLLND